MLKLLCSFCLFLGSMVFVDAQPLKISGRVVDKKSQRPIEFASVSLLNTRDSGVVAGTVTNAKGNFVIEKMIPGSYLLRYGFIGYETTTKDILLSAKNEQDLGTLELQPEQQQLNNVTVSATRSMLNTSIDRKSYDVTKDIMAQSGTASDVLKNIPSVEVDLEGNVALRGSGDVMILINGRPSPLMGKLSRAEVLQQYPANTIERIEVITNPSARYRPDGTSGIINIVLKKTVKGGWNGTLTANVGNKDRYNAAANMNYKTGKLNVFGNYGLRQDYRIRTNSINREYFVPGTNTINGYYTESGNSNANPLTHLGTLGFSYDPDSKNSFGVSGNYSNRVQLRTDVNTKIFMDKDHVYTSHLDRLRYDPEEEVQMDATAFYEHKFAGEDHSLRLELNMAKSDEVENNHYQNKYYYPVIDPTYDNTRIGQGSRQQQFTIDYSRMISEHAKLEAGYAGSFQQQDFDFYGEYFDAASSKFVKDLVRTNRFLYDESIHAFYGTYQSSMGKFGYQMGLRLEEAIIKGQQVTKDTTINNDYLKLYPTFHLAYELNDQGQLQLNYSRRVHRPEGDDINPFPEFQDPYNIRAGNAKLLPEIIHSLEFGYKWQNRQFSFVPSLYYRYKQNGFTQVTIPLNDSVMLTTQQNLSNDQSAGLELIFSAKAGSFFTGNISTNFFYNQIDAANLGYITRKTIVSFSTNFNSTFTFTPNTMLQVSANYRSARLTPQGKIYPSFVLNMGLRQDLFRKKVSVLMSVSDLLQTLQQRSELETPLFKQTSQNRRDAQIFYIGVSYKFGKSLKKDDKIQFDNAQ